MRDILVLSHPELAQYKQDFLVALEKVLAHHDFHLFHTHDFKEARDIIRTNVRIVAVLFDWEDYALPKLHTLMVHNNQLPIFAITDTHVALDLSLEDFNFNLNFLSYDHTLLHNDADRILQSIAEYVDNIKPPFTKALMHFVAENNYTFCTPGHLGGTAFEKSPVGTLFYDFYGPNIFLSDISISIEELGSLLDHSGPHLEAEQFIAEVFGAARSFIVTNGTSTSNKMVGMYGAAPGDVVLVDRNCHKSITHFMMMTDVRPIYLKPTRNAYGILGGIPRSEYSTDAIKAKIKKAGYDKAWPSYAVITNSTYDGLLYNVRDLHALLNMKHLHLDGAWIPYAHFHPIYQGKYGMSIEPQKGQVVFETQSTHKLLAAFSQTGMVHVKGDFDEAVFREVYMMHTTTSPFYPIVASAEISAGMMKGLSGQRLMREALYHACNFRAEIQRLYDASSDGWFYKVWQPSHITKPVCWPLTSHDNWHEFENIDDNHMFLDPLKVTLLLPGIRDGKMEKTGIPGPIVDKFLETHGIIVEKTGPYSLLFLFSLGINAPKTLKLLAALNQFKQLYDENAYVQTVLPQVYAAYPQVYQHMRIQTLAQQYHDLMLKYDLPKVMMHAMDILPDMVMTPHEAYQHFIRKNVELVSLEAIEGRTLATMVLPYPPGIPLIMPGEKITAASKPILDFLLMLHAIHRSVAGFSIDVHGVVEEEDGGWKVWVVKLVQPQQSKLKRLKNHHSIVGDPEALIDLKVSQWSDFSRGQK